MANTLDNVIKQQEFDNELQSCTNQLEEMKSLAMIFLYKLGGETTIREFVASNDETIDKILSGKIGLSTKKIVGEDGEGVFNFVLVEL